MDLILFSKLVIDDALRIEIVIEFHSLAAVYECDLPNKEEQHLGTVNARLTDRSVRLWVSATGFSKSVIYLLSNISWLCMERRPCCILILLLLVANLIL